MSKPTTHGGPRKGAGRPAGKKSANAKGRTAVTRSVSMQPESWQKLDRDRGDQSRGKYIETKLFGGKGPQYEVVMDHRAKSIHLIPVK
jgi:hypothetical protein